MNSYTTSARYMRLAACALFLSSCGQTKCAGDDINQLWPSAGAALSLVSAITRYCNPPMSPLGMALDLTCAATNTYAACSYKPNVVTNILDLGCVFSLGLQYTGLVSALAAGFKDPLWQIRALINFANAGIISYRLYNNYNRHNTN